MQLTYDENLRSRLAEDPGRIPEMALEVFDEHRAAFGRAHPDVLLSIFNEPHQRFVERMARDVAVHSKIFNYPLGEVRLRFEEVKTRPVFSETAEHLLQVAKEDCPTFITSEENAMQRLHTLCVGLEYVGIMSFFRGAQGSDGRWIGGSLTCLQQMEERRHSTSGVQFVVLTEKLIRGMVHKVFF